MQLIKEICPYSSRLIEFLVLGTRVIREPYNLLVSFHSLD